MHPGTCICKYHKRQVTEIILLNTKKSKSNIHDLFWKKRSSNQIKHDTLVETAAVCVIDTHFHINVLSYRLHEYLLHSANTSDWRISVCSSTPMCAMCISGDMQCVWARDSDKYLREENLTGS